MVDTRSAPLFFDGGDADDEAAIIGGVEGPRIDRGAEAEYVLRRVVVPSTHPDFPPREQFRLDRRIGYDDREFGRILVPRRLQTFHTDLTSVPQLLTWLVPKSGAHLPAALIHDGLVSPPDDEAEYIGDPAISRVDADRIFRDAMRDAGTGALRRWLVWAAVTIATLWNRQGTAGSRALRLYYQFVPVVLLASISWLGYQATADLVGRSGSWVCTYELPWIVGDTFWEEFLSGGLFAILIPVAMSVLWWRFWRAGAIAGIAIAFLLHVTIGIALVQAVNVFVETIASRGWGSIGYFGRAFVRRVDQIGTAVAVVAAVGVVCGVLR